MSGNSENSMRPYLGVLAGTKELATDIKLFQIELQEPAGKAAFADYQPGQFAFVSAFGYGEAPFGITSIPGRTELLEFAIHRHPQGRTTNGLHNLKVGDPVGVRGPLGNCFPMDDIKGKDIIVLGGGIGGAPLRPVISTIIDDRDRYGKMTIQTSDIYRMVCGYAIQVLSVGMSFFLQSKIIVVIPPYPGSLRCLFSFSPQIPRNVAY